MALIKVSLAIVTVLIVGADCDGSLKNYNYLKDNENVLDQSTSVKENTDNLITHPVKRRIYDSVGGRVGSGRGGGVSAVAWRGRWFPEAVAGAAPAAAQGPGHSAAANRGRHLDQMKQMLDPACDDAKTNLTLDWSGSLENYTCFLNTIRPDPYTPAYIMRDYIPTAYSARHECMNKPIYYNKNLPTFGTHRPAWPRYGEYTFVPRQRWLHSLEHGAIVMLYHPCAHPLLVRQLRDIVKSCLYRHVITPYTLLSEERPLAVVAWGWAMTMSMVDTDIVQEFISAHALKGPEKLSQDGQYDYLLEKPAAIVTSEDDSTVCPQRAPAF